MKWSTAKPFIHQMLVCIFVYTTIAFCAIYNNVIEFHINDIFSVVIAVIFFFGVIIPQLNIIIFGIKVLIDFFSKKTKEDSYLFLREIPVRYSVFSETIDKNHNKIIPNYYQIIVSKDNIEYYLLSTDYLKLTKGEIYRFKVSQLSKMIISTNQ